MNNRHSLGLVVLMTLGATGACGGDDGDQVPVDTDTGADTGVATETSVPETGEMDSTMPDTTTGDTAMATDGDAATMTTPTLNFQVVNVSDWHGQLEPLKETDAITEIDRFYGGLGVYKTYWDEDRAKMPTIAATSGDVTGATPPLSWRGTALPDEPAVVAMNYLGLQVDTLGNHNFDRGIALYTKLIDLAKYQITTANLANVDSADMTCGINGMTTGPCGFAGKKPDGSPRIVKPYAMIKVGTGANTVNVAFVGLITPDAPKLQFPGMMGKITVENPAVRANEAAALARKDGAHVVVVLAHIGATGFDPVTMKPTGPLIDDVAAMKPELINLVLGDHTNARVDTTIGGIRVVENLSAGRTYARTVIKVVDGKVTAVEPTIIDPLGTEFAPRETLMGSDMKAVTCNSTTPCPTATPAWTCSSTSASNGYCRRAHACNAATNPTTCPTGFTCAADGKSCSKVTKAADPAAATLLKPWQDSLAAQVDVVIGKTTRAFQRGPTCPPSASCPPTARVNLEREYQQPIGDLIADALLDRYAAQGAKIGIQNGGGIRASIPSNHVPQLFTKVISAGTTPPALTVSGTPVAAYDIKVEVRTGGALGTMAFRYSSDGGTTWSTDTTSAADGRATLGTTGVNVVFAAGTYATDNVYTFSTKKFTRSNCSDATPCDIVIADIYSVNNFNNRSTVRPITAQTLWQALENGVSTRPGADGRFLQIAGFKFSYSLSAPVGARVKKITLNDGTVLMDTNATPAIVADTGKACTTDADCSGGSLGTGNFVCITDLDAKNKCMIKMATNNFVNEGGETAPFKPGAKLGNVYGDMADDIIEYIKSKMTLSPLPSNFLPPPASATTTRVIELP